MKKIIFCLLVIFQISCIGFAQTSALEKYSSVTSMSTPYVDKIDMQTDQNKITITEADWISYQFNKLEEFDPDFQYNVYGKVKVNGYTILLIERRYTEESNHWAVYISEDQKIFSYKNIAYDNSEGFLYIESEVGSDKITIKEDNSFNENSHSETSYSVNKSGFIQE